MADLSLRVHVKPPFVHYHSRETVLEVLRPRFECFTLQNGEGFFCGHSEPVLLVRIATEDGPALIGAAEELRCRLNQIDIGIEYSGRYNHCCRSSNADDVGDRPTITWCWKAFFGSSKLATGGAIFSANFSEQMYVLGQHVAVWEMVEVCQRAKAISRMRIILAGPNTAPNARSLIPKTALR